MVERRLGRGLDYLLSGDLKASTGEVAEVELSSIVPNPYQPRHVFPEPELDELAASIAEHGVLQPIILRRNEDRYEIIAGERRFRASKRAGRVSIPAIVREADDTQMLEIALVENIQRENLNAIEIALGYDAYIQRLGLTQQEAARRLGKSRSAVTNTLRLLDLPADLQEMVSRGTLSAGHARAMLPLDDAEAQRALSRRIVDRGLSVRDVEQAVRSKGGGRTAERRGRAEKAPHLTDLEDQLRESLGTRVTITPSREAGGKIVLSYHSDEELERLIGLFKAE